MTSFSNAHIDQLRALDPDDALDPSTPSAGRLFAIWTDLWGAPQNRFHAPCDPVLAEYLAGVLAPAPGPPDIGEWWCQAMAHHGEPGALPGYWYGDLGLPWKSGGPCDHLLITPGFGLLRVCLFKPFLKAPENLVWGISTKAHKARKGQRSDLAKRLKMMFGRARSHRDRVRRISSHRSVRIGAIESQFSRRLWGLESLWGCDV